MEKLLIRLADGMSLPLRLFRFAWVGIFSGLMYMLVVGFYVEIATFGAKWSSVFGYITVLPVNFIGHRKLTFRSANNALPEVFRFLSVHTINVGISVAGMYGVVDLLGYSHWFGSLTAVVLVPISTFLMMDRWVFTSHNK